MSIPLLDTGLDIPEFLRTWLLYRREPEKHKISEWTAIEAEERRRAAVVADARTMMKTAYHKYISATRHLQGDELQTFKHWQSPQRILVIDPGFLSLVEKLRDPKTWNLLSKQERRFIVEACQFAGIAG